MQNLRLALHNRKEWLQNHIHQFFEIGITLKAIHAGLELIGAGFVFFVSKTVILKAASRLAAPELSEDSRDLVANLFMQGAHDLTTAKMFVAAYLLVSAIINLILVAGLYANKHFAYPIAMGVLSLFVSYQIYRLTLRFSWLLLAFTAFDCLVIWLIYLEYERRWAHHS